MVHCPWSSGLLIKVGVVSRGFAVWRFIGAGVISSLLGARESRVSGCFAWGGGYFDGLMWLLVEIVVCVV